MVNLWKDLETGPAPPSEVYAVTESVKGSRNKYVYDRNMAVFLLERVLRSCVHYPGDFGFIPRTYCEDEEPLDILILVDDSTFPGCIIACRPVAVLRMHDSGFQDDKILAVPIADPRRDHIRDLSDVSTQLRDEIEQFFATYKRLESDAAVETHGWNDENAARTAIQQAQERFREKVG